MKNKTLLIGLILVIIIIVAAEIFFGRRASTTTPAPLPLAQQAQPNTSFTQPPNVVFSFTTKPTTPSDLPTYQFQAATRASVEQLAQHATSSLNLQATPSALQMTDTYTKTWTRPNEAALVVTQTKDGITLSFQQVRAQKGAPARAPQDAASAFLSLFFTSTPDISIQPTDISSGPFDGLLVLDPPNPPEYKGYNFRYAVGGYAVTTGGLSYNTASVVVDSAGAVRSANIVPPPSSIRPVGAVTALTPDQIISSLSAGRGSLLDTHDTQDISVGSAPVFSSFSIEDTKIVYAAQNDQLFPAFLLSGTGVGAGGITQKATFFLWAYPSGTTTQ